MDARTVWKSMEPAMAAGGYVGDRRPVDLAGDQKEMEPSLLLPMGFGAILVNLPLSGAVTQVLSTGTEVGPLDVLFDAGIANELFPLLLFVGIGAMIDFTPLLSNPKLMILGRRRSLASFHAGGCGFDGL